MKHVHANLIGRFGNQLFTYAYARALAEERGYGFSCTPWIGNQIFDLNESQSEQIEGYDFIVISDYCQRQECLIYSRKQAKQWFQFKPEIKSKLDPITGYWLVAHRRAGDYEKLGYVVVTVDSYFKAASEFGYDPIWIWFVSEESPLCPPDFRGNLSFLPDFYMMTRAQALFRANSSFSWWAATLSDATVYAPVVDGLEGGKEQDCKFIKGNWPRFANLEFVTDLHLPE